MNQHSARYPKADAGVLSRPNTPVSLPRVNVVVTCFNYGRFIGEALDSVAAQSYENFDCVVVDDASTDDSFEIVERWISNRQDNRFRLIRNVRNSGQMASLAAGLRGTQGEFVALLDADDLWFSEFLMRHIEVHLNTLQPAGASCSDLIQIDAHGRALTGLTMPPPYASSEKEAVLSQNDIPVLGAGEDLARPKPTKARRIPADWGTWHWSVTSGMVFRRPLVELLIPDDTEQLRLGADFYLMALGHFFVGSFVIKNALGAYRRHGNNNFSTLPTLGWGASAPLAGSLENAENVYRAAFVHLLEASDRFSAVCSPAMVRKRARTMLRFFLRLEMKFDDPRLNAIVGRGQVARDRMRAKIGFLRRRLR